MPLDVAKRRSLDIKDPPLKAIVSANDNYDKGYHEGNVGGLDAVDADLAAANILTGKNIFGKAGSVIQQGTETIERAAYQVLVAGTSYTPADAGVFCASMATFTAALYIELYSANGVWQYVAYSESSDKLAIGDGTNLRFRNSSASSNGFVCTRHFYSTGTYQRFYDADLAGGASYTPASSGLYTVNIGGGYFTNNWDCNGTWVGGSQLTRCLAVSEGTSYSVTNTDGTTRRIVLMRAKLT